MVRKSKWIFILLSLFLLFISIRAIIYVNLYNKIENDANSINELGIIRGSIQRYVKLELEAHEENNSEEKVNELLHYYINQYKTLDNKSINTKKLTEFKLCWEQLKLTIREYRNNPSEEIRIKIIDKSEECWELANNIVLNSQMESERKVSMIWLLTLSFVFDLLIIIIMSFISKKYVYDNLESSALFDPLTNAYNRKYFTEATNNEIAKASRTNSAFSLIMLDIDYFKRVNDTFGHAAGDYVLKELVLVIKNSIRKYDLLSRIGGEEFTIILPATDIKQAYNLAERLRSSIEDHIFDDVGKITISLGITQYEDGITLDTMLKRADNALYKAKNNGRNRTEIELHIKQ